MTRVSTRMYTRSGGSRCAALSSAPQSHAIIASAGMPLHNLRLESFPSNLKHVLTSARRPAGCRLPC